MRSAEAIKFDNILEEAKYAFRAGDIGKAKRLLREALAIAVHESVEVSHV